MLKKIEKRRLNWKKRGSLKLPKFFLVHEGNLSLEFLLSIIAYLKQLAGGGNRDKSERIGGYIAFKLEELHVGNMSLESCSKLNFFFLIVEIQ
jgi:hypothetical protein